MRREWGGSRGGMTHTRTHTHTHTYTHAHTHGYHQIYHIFFGFEIIPYSMQHQATLVQTVQQAKPQKAGIIKSIIFSWS